MRHATVSAWQRQEDGSYTAEMNGWTLRVEWHPESPRGPRGFSWAARNSGGKLASDEIFEEIEVAMAYAEERVAPDPDVHEAKTAELGDDSGHPRH